VIFFLLYLFLETLISVNVASQIGAMNTFLEIILSAIVGGFIFKNVGFAKVKFEQIKQRKLDPNDAARDTIFKMIGALMLILPGFFSDMIGVLFQFSFFSAIIAKQFFKTDIKTRSSYETHKSVIDVEVVDGDDAGHQSIGK
jgi:2-isopropylmalate synthase/UPF0716 protein FxsA